MESWYFAYGSNLCVNQMIARTGTLWNAGNSPKIACLANHRLAFQQLDTAEVAFANIQSPGNGVLGVVYRCSPNDLAKLDRYEVGYERQPIVVTLEHGEILTAVTYVMQPALAARHGKPIAHYLETIVSGARGHGLPPEYISRIVATARSGAFPRTWV
jgi:gamma-glutamylcyclotransferase